MRQVLLRTNGPLPGGASTPRALSFDEGAGITATSDFSTYFVWPSSGAFKNLVTRLSGASGGGSTRTFTLEIDGVLTALSTTHSTSSVAERNTTAVVSITAGQIVRLIYSHTGNPAAQDVNWTIEFDSTGTAESAYSISNLAGSTFRGNPFNGAAETTIGFAEARMPCDGSIVAMFAAASTTLSGSNTSTVRLYKNGVLQNGSGGTTETAVLLSNVAIREVRSSSFSLSFVRGDRIAVAHVVAGTPNNPSITVGIRVQTTVAGRSIMVSNGSQSGTDPSASVDNFMHPADPRVRFWNSSELYQWRYTCGVSAVTLKEMYVYVDTNPSPGNRRFRMRKNAAYPSSGPDATIVSGGSLTGGDLVGSVRYVDGDVVGTMGHTPTSTPTVSGYEGWSFVMEADQPVETTLPLDPGGTIGLTWVEFIDAASVTHKWSMHPLPDPSTYYGGYKEPRVISWGEITRALSDDQGTYIGSQAGWTLDDTDRFLRRLRADPVTKYIYNRPVTIRSITDDQRRLFLTPRTLFRGRVRAPSADQGMTYSMQAEEWMASLFESGQNEQQSPRRVITRTDFPDAPTQFVGKAVPTIYGRMEESASASAPPVLTGDPARGAMYVADAPPPYPDDLFVAGWGDMPDPPGQATGVSATENAGGSINSAQVAGGTLYVMVVIENSAGVLGDPHIFNSFNTTAVAVTGSGKKIDVSWTYPGDAGAGYKARVYLGADFWNLVNLDTDPTKAHTKQVNSAQYIAVSYPTTSCSFNKHPPIGEDPTPSNIATGSNLIDHFATGFYVVSANMADGETGVSKMAIGRSAPYRRHIRVEWLAVAGALSYNVYRKDTKDGTWNRRWVTLNTYFEDDFLDTGAVFIDAGGVGPSGQVDLIPCGRRVAADGSVWHQYLVCGHACKKISRIFIDGVAVDTVYYGTHALVPGETGYSTFFPSDAGNPQYRDINGRRYTFVYGRGPASDAAMRGELRVTANVQGVETVGDSSGTLITSIYDQYLHWLLNYAVRDYQTGLWATTSPTFVDDASLAQIDVNSFATCKTISQTRVPPAGYEGAVILGANDERLSIRDVIARFNMSGDTFSGFNRFAQFSVVMFQDFPSTSSATLFTQEDHIFEGSFSTRDMTESLATEVPYYFSKDYTNRYPTGWKFEGKETSNVDVVGFGGYAPIDGGLRQSRTRELHMVRSAAIAADIARRYLKLFSGPPQVIEFQVSAGGMNVDLGDYILVRHKEAIGVEAGGTVTVTAMVTAIRFNPMSNTTTITCIDVAVYSTTVGPSPVQAVQGARSVQRASATYRRRALRATR